MVVCRGSAARSRTPSSEEQRAINHIDARGSKEGFSSARINSRINGDACSIVLHRTVLRRTVLRLQTCLTVLPTVLRRTVGQASPLQSNIFSNDQEVRVLSVGTHNHNTASYTKNDFKEIEHGNQVAPKSSEHEKRVLK